MDKSAIRTRVTGDIDQDDDTTVVKTAAPPRIPAAGSGSDEGPVAVVSTVYSSTGDAMPHQYAGDATHTTEIDTAIEKYGRVPFICRSGPKIFKK